MVARRLDMMGWRHRVVEQRPRVRRDVDCGAAARWLEVAAGGRNSGWWWRRVGGTTTRHLGGGYGSGGELQFGGDGEDRLTLDHSFKSPAIAAAIARYSLLRQGTAIYVHVQFSRYISL